MKPVWTAVFVFVLGVLATITFVRAEVNLPPIGTPFTFKDRVLGCDTVEQIRMVIDAKVKDDPTQANALFVPMPGQVEPACIVGPFANVTVGGVVEVHTVNVGGVVWQVHVLGVKTPRGFQFYVLLPFKAEGQGGA